MLATSDRPFEDDLAPQNGIAGVNFEVSADGALKVYRYLGSKPILVGVSRQDGPIAAGESVELEIGFDDGVYTYRRRNGGSLLSFSVRDIGPVYATFGVRGAKADFSQTTIGFRPSTAVVVGGTSSPAVPSTFLSWQAANFSQSEFANPLVSGPNGVVGQDGVPNLLRYAFGLGRSDIFTGVGSMTLDSTGWSYAYTRPSGLDDVSFTVEVSTDLLSWSSTGVVQTLQDSRNSRETWLARFPGNSGPMLFARVRVSLP